MALGHCVSGKFSFLINPGQARLADHLLIRPDQLRRDEGIAFVETISESPERAARSEYRPC